jgi:hypothetical protein
MRLDLGLHQIIRRVGIIVTLWAVYIRILGKGRKLKLESMTLRCFFFLRAGHVYFMVAGFAMDVKALDAGATLSPL